MKLLALAGALLLAVGIVNATDEQRAVISAENAAEIQLLTTVYEPANDICRPYCMISDLAFNNEGATLAFINAPTLNLNGSVLFYDMRAGTLIGSSDDGTVPDATRLRFDNIGNRLVLGTEFGEIIIIDATTLSILDSQSVSDGGGVRSIAISPDDAYFAVSANSSDRIGDYAFYLSAFDSAPILRISSNEWSLSFGTAFHPSGEAVAFAALYPDREGTVWLFDVATGEEIASCGNYEPFADDLAITSDGSFLIYPASDGVRVWDMRNCVTNADAWEILLAAEEDLSVTSLALHPSEPLVAVGYRDDRRLSDTCCTGMIQLWDIRSREMLLELDAFGSNSSVSALAFSPDGTLLASGGTDGTVRLWGIPNE